MLKMHTCFGKMRLIFDLCSMLIFSQVAWNKWCTSVWGVMLTRTRVFSNTAIKPDVVVTVIRQLYIYYEDYSMAGLLLALQRKLWIIVASTRETCISPFLKKRVRVLMLSTCKYVHLCIYSLKTTKRLSLCLIIGCLNWRSKYSDPR